MRLSGEIKDEAFTGYVLCFVAKEGATFIRSLPLNDIDYIADGIVIPIPRAVYPRTLYLRHGRFCFASTTGCWPLLFRIHNIEISLHVELAARFQF